ncbi:MAG: potassium transporter [Bdellovibrionales bacterium]|nr:potassium transporter [Bdellovibrionales bacterium]
MKFPLILKTLGSLTILISFALLVPLATSLYYQGPDVSVFCYSAAGCFSAGVLMYLCFRKAEGQLRNRDALLLVSLGWVGMTVVGSIPYMIYGGPFTSFIDAWFESSSGFTTTGASIVSDIESLPHGVLIWRSFTQYLGGMGIIVLSVAILPLIGVGGMELYRAEVPGPTSEKISARVGETARILWIVYLAFGTIETILLYLSGMTLFDAVNHSMTTMSTGGFSTKNASVAGFNSVLIDWIITLFMFFGGLNFLLHYRFFVRRDPGALGDWELKHFTLLVLSSILLLTVYVWGSSYPTFPEALRYASFQAVSIVTTTGFATADYVLWGPFAHSLLLVLMIIGGCAGSTAGGIKCVRAAVLLKQGYRELYLTIHRKAVFPLKLGGMTVPANVISAIFGFFFLYIFILVLTGFFITASGVDMVTAFSGVISSLSNIGPGLGEVGPALNYSGLPALAKVLLSACMIIGRLEIFTILVLFTSEFWET